MLHKNHSSGTQVKKEIFILLSEEKKTIRKLLCMTEFSKRAKNKKIGLMIYVKICTNHLCLFVFSLTLLFGNIKVSFCFLHFNSCGNYGRKSFSHFFFWKKSNILFMKKFFMLFEFIKNLCTVAVERSRERIKT